MADLQVAVITPGPFAGLFPRDLCHRRDITTSQLAAAYERASDLVHRAEGALAEHRALRRAFTEALRDRQRIAARQELLHRSEHARLVARLQTCR